MFERTLDLHSYDETRLHVHSWQAEQADKILVVVHGMGGHGGYYRNSLAPFATLEGAVVYAPDLRGHGRSEGLRGDIDDFKHFQHDVDATIAYARSQHPGLPLFLLGESMGTPIAITYAATSQHRPDGLILVACVVAPTIKPRIDEIFRTTFYFTFNQRKIALPITGREEQGVRDLAFVQELKTDALFNRRVSVRFLTQMTRTMNRAAQMHDKLTMPVLLLQGGKDITIRHRPTRAFFERLAATDKEMHIFPNAFHAILNDPDSPQVRAKIFDWLQRQCLNHALLVGN